MFAGLELHADLHFIGVAVVALTALAADGDLEAGCLVFACSQQCLLCFGAFDPYRKVDLHALEGQALG
ncbi:hypothetical protein D3C75_997070 [compost metagenome]